VLADDGRLGVLLLGFASVGDQFHQRTMYAPPLTNHPQLYVVAVADETTASSEQHALNSREAEALGVPYIADLATALGDPRVDVVSVCCPFDRRLEVIRDVAEAGKHMLVDKPLALTLADCVAIEEAVASAGVVCMPAHHYRFHPAIRAARAAVAVGSIGLPWAVHAEFLISAGTAAWPLGELLNFGLYPVDAMRAILGLEVRSVYASVGSFFYADGVDDLAVLALTFEHGIIATTSVGRTPTPNHPNGYDGDRRLRIMGSHGSLVIDAAKPALSVYSAAPGSLQQYYGGESLRGLLDHFVGAVRGAESPELGPRDARAALEIVLAARTSAAEQRVVTLPLAGD
jgi:predicted dehydrogenase